MWPVLTKEGVHEPFSEKTGHPLLFGERTLRRSFPKRFSRYLPVGVVWAFEVGEDDFRSRFCRALRQRCFLSRVDHQGAASLVNDAASAQTVNGRSGMDADSVFEPS
ncbi:hypothetical protein ES703_110568 [subsurface metagenome]